MFRLLLSYSLSCISVLVACNSFLSLIHSHFSFFFFYSLLQWPYQCVAHWEVRFCFFFFVFFFAFVIGVEWDLWNVGWFDDIQKCILRSWCNQKIMNALGWSQIINVFTLFLSLCYVFFFFFIFSCWFIVYQASVNVCNFSFFCCVDLFGFMVLRVCWGRRNYALIFSYLIFFVLFLY